MTLPDNAPGPAAVAGNDWSPSRGPAEGPRRRVLLAAGEGGGGPFGEILAQAGCDLDTVADGARVMAVAAASPYNLILMDLALPGQPVLALLRGIRRLPHPHGDAAILALGVGAEGPDPDLLYAAGLDGVLDPAGDAAQLRVQLAHWLAAAEDPMWGLEAHPGLALPLLNRRTLAQLEEDLGTELVPEVLEAFFRESVRRLSGLQERVAAGEPGAAADEAHAIKGSAGTFGALALRQAVQAMEQAGRAGDGARLLALLPEVRRLADLTAEALREHYRPAPGGASER